MTIYNNAQSRFNLHERAFDIRVVGRGILYLFSSFTFVSFFFVGGGNGLQFVWVAFGWLAMKFLATFRLLVICCLLPVASAVAASPPSAG